MNDRFCPAVFVIEVSQIESPECDPVKMYDHEFQTFMGESGRGLVADIYCDSRLQFINGCTTSSYVIPTRAFGDCLVIVWPNGWEYGIHTQKLQRANAQMGADLLHELGYHDDDEYDEYVHYSSDPFPDYDSDTTMDGPDPFA